MPFLLAGSGPRLFFLGASSPTFAGGDGGGNAVLERILEKGRVLFSSVKRTRGRGASSNFFTSLFSSRNSSPHPFRFNRHFYHPTSHSGHTTSLPPGVSFQLLRSHHHHHTLADHHTHRPSLPPPQNKQAVGYQTVARFDCKMTLGFEPVTGRFLFDDGATQHFSACTFESYMWHHAVVGGCTSCESSWVAQL
jgi:hypothetical protein